MPQIMDDSSPATWSEHSLVQSGSNFQRVPRISALEPSETVIAKIREHEQTGVPLIVGDWDKQTNWDFKKFSLEGFLENAEQLIFARDIRTSEDIEMRLDELVGHYQQIIEGNCLEENTLYGKDLPCPKAWQQWLRKCLPEHCHPLGSNDMFSHLSRKEQPETLMCYVGIDETFTPAHKDACGSFGQNIMCYASDQGAAFWFMSETGHIDKDEASEYFRTQLNTDLDLESHKLTVNEFRKAPFTVYCAKQCVGDLVLVPPRSCHQVVNAGGITIKMSWSRMGLKSLEYSLHSELCLYHRICRPEVYRVKLTVFRALQAHAWKLNQPNCDRNLPYTTLDILHLFDQILVEEWSSEPKSSPFMEPDETDSPVFYSCDFCGADIFTSFLGCTGCCNSDNTQMYICCPSCYVEGRACKCGPEYMHPYQATPFKTFVNERNRIAAILKPHLKKCFQLKWAKDITRSHIPIFEAACLYHTRVKNHVKNNRGHSVCQQYQKRDHKHQPPSQVVFQCATCHRGLCFEHALKLRYIHSTEVLLAHQRGSREWHDRHMYKPKEPGPVPESVQLYYGEHSKRLVEAALAVTVCHPLDSERSSPGFYDKIDT